MSSGVRSDGKPNVVEDGKSAFDILTPRFREGRFPMSQILGYLASVILTLGALFLVLRHPVAPRDLLAAILGLAVIQAGVQLAVFMHLRESRGPAWHLVVLGLAFFTAIGMVVASIWIMAFKWGVS